MIWLHRPQTLLGKTYGEIVARAAGVGEQGAPLDRLDDDRLVVRLTDSGAALIFDDEPALRAVQLYSDGRHGFRRFVWPLPFGLSFAMTPALARAALGPPARSGGGASLPVLGLQAAWDQFEVAGFRLHIEYTLDATAVRMVTLTRLGETA